MVHQATAKSLSSNPSSIKQLLIAAAIATVAAGGVTGYAVWRSRLPDPSAAKEAAAATASQLSSSTKLITQIN
ncbi:MULTISPECIES: hypothetical protein [unclassified Microcoleus]|uniref:hypothetical protein n=1 Tax=unclassified Microcoleus TaxID=2642155 RepID=UPI002FD0644D